MATSQTLTLQALLLWTISSVSVTSEKLCPYEWFDDDEDDRSWFRPADSNLRRGYEKCEWGCCSEYVNPCCSPPIGLIVGAAIGGLVLLVVVVLTICCCCCVCRKNRNRQAGRVLMYPGTSNIASTQSADLPPHYSECSQNAPINTSLPPGVYLAPPSYDEVMAEFGGHANPAFKADPETIL